MLKNLSYLKGSGKRGKKPSKKKLNDVKIVCGNEDKLEEINLTKDKDKYINCETIYIKNIKNQFADFFKTNNLINLFFDVDVGKEIKINPENIPNLKTLNIYDNKINFDNINKNTIKIYEESNILDYLNLYKKGEFKNYNKTSPSIIFKNLEELKIRNCKIKTLLPITPKLKKLELILNYKNIHKTTIPYRMDLIKEIEDIHIDGYTTKLLSYTELENCKKIVLKNTLIDILPSVKNLNILKIDSINVNSNTGTLPYDFFKNNKELSKVKEIYFNNIYFDKRFSNIDLNWNSNSINFNFL